MRLGKLQGKRTRNARVKIPARLLKLTDTLDVDAAIGTAAAADMLAAD